MMASILCKTGFYPLLSRIAPRLQQVARRTLLTAIQEPSLDSSVPERPCTLILGQDPGLYESSWQTTFEKLPNEFGISYGEFSIDTSIISVDEALQEMKHDLGNLNDVVFVARGPWMSWMAQFYLESLPFSGLIMVDPLPLDDQNGINQFELYYTKQNLQDSQEYRLFQEFVNHWNHWTLQLEPGAVPMLVLHTITRPAFKRCADNTAFRHSDPDDGPFGPVPVIKLPVTSQTHADETLNVITSWINDCVL